MKLSQKNKVSLILAVLSSTAFGHSIKIENGQTDTQGFQPLMIKADPCATKQLSDLLIEGEKQLKHVNESDMNTYAKALLAKKDPYDAKADLNSFVKKLRVDDGFVLKNDTNEVMELSLKFQSKSNTDFYKKNKITLKPGEFYI